MSQVSGREFGHSTGARNHFSKSLHFYLLFDDRLIDPVEIFLVVIFDLEPAS